MRSIYFKGYHHAMMEASDEKFDQFCPGHGKVLKQSLIELDKCRKRVDDSLTLCESVQSSVLNCTKPVLDIVDQCVPQTAKGLPSLAVESLVSVLDRLCKMTGESILGNFKKTSILSL